MTPKTSFANSIECPLFVTWQKGVAKDLRGCIGSFEPLSLTKGLQEFALVSAFEDDRFKPIQVNELKQLHCSVSLLVKFSEKPLANPLDWKVGKHGISLQIRDQRGQFYESTFLPEVALEEGWD